MTYFLCKRHIVVRKMRPSGGLSGGGGDIHWDHGASNARGVLILIGNKFQGKNMESITGFEGRAVMLRFQIDNEEYMAVNLYAPNADNPTFYERIFKAMMMKEAQHYLVGGDFNLVLDPDMDSMNRKGNNEKSRQVILNFMEKEDVFRAINPD